MSVNCLALLPFALFAHVFSLMLAGVIIDLRGVEVKRLIPLIALVVIPASIPLLVVSDTGPSLADSNIANDELTTSQTEASNSSASATITITMTTAPNG